MNKGLSSIHLDPEKVNPLLNSLPFKLVEGVISGVRLDMNMGGMSLDLSIDSLKVILYLDDHSAYKPFHTVSSYKVVVCLF